MWSKLIERESRRDMDAQHPSWKAINLASNMAEAVGDILQNSHWTTEYITDYSGDNLPKRSRCLKMHCSSVFACERVGLRTQHPPFFCRPGCHVHWRHHPAGSPALKSVLMDCVHSQLLCHHTTLASVGTCESSYFTRRAHKLANQLRFL